MTQPPSKDPSFTKSKPQRDVYALQVQAFLDAADEVDIDQEIATDILQGFDGDLQGNEIEIEADGKANADYAINVHKSDEEDSDLGDAGDDDSSELDAYEEEGEISEISFHI
jgi:NAD-dependent histone deacetylase SIR2